MMAISAISPASAPPAAAASTPAVAAPADGPAGSFAALLHSQLGNANGLAKQAGSGEQAGTDQESPLDPASLATDPALAFLMGMPVQQPLSANQNAALDSTGLEISGKGSASANALLGQAALESPVTGGKNAALTPSALIAAEQAGKEKNDSFPLSTKPTVDTARFADLLGEQGKEGLAAAAKDGDRPGGSANIAVEAASLPSGQEINAATLNAGQPSGKAENMVQSRNEISLPLQSSQWGRDFGEKIVWLAKNDQQSAEINIHPAHLGPVQITLQINGDQATASFASPHADVRQAIADSLPQLKEMLSGAGINLGQADVGANFGQQRREALFQQANGNRSGSENAILPGSANAGDGAVSLPMQRGRGMVDLFA